MLQANITSGSAEISLTHSQVIMDRMDRTPSREFLPEIKELKSESENQTLPKSTYTIYSNAAHP